MIVAMRTVQEPHVLGRLPQMTLTFTTDASVCIIEETRSAKEDQIAGIAFIGIALTLFHTATAPIGKAAFHMRVHPGAFKIIVAIEARGVSETTIPRQEDVTAFTEPDAIVEGEHEQGGAGVGAGRPGREELPNRVPGRAQTVMIGETAHEQPIVLLLTDGGMSGPGRG